ncbi:MAG: DUF6268 family outer membrane beta-barrel protein [Aquaticitalea sp.]
MRAYFFVIFLTSYFCNAQDYVDILRLGYGNTFNNTFEGTNSSTDIGTFEADITFPIVLNEKNALITGAIYSKNRLQLFPEGENINLKRTVLKIGLATTFSEKYSSTIVLLPKITSDYINVSHNDFYFGGLAILKYKKNENLKYKFGLYASQEAYGLFTTPIIGWYYLSPNKKFEMDMTLPIAADVNYKFGKLSVGMDYFGIGGSYKLHQEPLKNKYVAVGTLNFAGYLQYEILKDILLRGKLGYSTSKYDVYSNGDKIDLGLAAFNFGDDRTQLNPNINGSPYFKFELIYRFNILTKL